VCEVCLWDQEDELFTEKRVHDISL
jgi:hypothetical protein